MSWPKRLKNAASLVSTATRSSAGCRPSSAYARIACGSRFTPTPTALISGALSNTLRPLVAGAPPERLAIDELAEAVEERGFLGLDRHAFERRLQTELRVRAHRVRQQVHADPDGLDFRRALEHAAATRSRRAARAARDR